MIAVAANHIRYSVNSFLLTLLRKQGFNDMTVLFYLVFTIPYHTVLFCNLRLHFTARLFSDD